MSQRSISGLAVTIGAALVLTTAGAFAQTAPKQSDVPMRAESAHDAMKPEAAKPDAMKPDAMKATAAKPDAMKPETATHVADPAPVVAQK